MTRSNLVLSFNNNDAAAAARVIGAMTTAGSMVDFLFGPMLGRLSDRYGRRLFLLLGPFGAFFCDGLVFLFPTQSVLIAGKIVTTVTLTGFVTILRGALNDVVQGEAYAVANSGMAMWTGTAQCVVPLVVSRFFTYRAAYGVSALFAGLNSLYLLTSFRETLSPGERVPVNWMLCNPLSFLKLFTHSRTLSLLAMAVFFQTLGEVRFTMDIAILVWRQIHGWAPQRVGNLTALAGIFFIIAGKLGVLTIRRFGQLGHTHLSNLMNIVANTGACTRPYSYYIVADLNRHHHHHRHHHRHYHSHQQQ